jgi:hypothetical protein
MVVLLACVAIAVMTGQLRPTNEHMVGADRPQQHLGPTVFRTDPSVFPSTTTVLP